MRLALDFMKILEKKISNLYTVNKLEGESDFEFYPYNNGREQGFAILRSDYANTEYQNFKTIVFGEHRNVDKIRLFYGLNKDFDDGWTKNKSSRTKKYFWSAPFHRNFIPSEKIFRKQEKVFGLDSKKEVKKVVDFIRSFLNE